MQASWIFEYFKFPGFNVIIHFWFATNFIPKSDKSITKPKLQQYQDNWSPIILGISLREVNENTVGEIDIIGVVWLEWRRMCEESQPWGNDKVGTSEEVPSISNWQCMGHEKISQSAGFGYEPRI